MKKKGKNFKEVFIENQRTLNMCVNEVEKNSNFLHVTCKQKTLLLYQLPAVLAKCKITEKSNFSAFWKVVE